MRRKFWKRGKRGLTWMAAGALFLTLWSRLRDDRLADKMGAGGLTEVHDLPAFSLERSSEADGLGGRRTGQALTTFSGKREPRRSFRLSSVDTGPPEPKIASCEPISRFGLRD